MKTIQPKNYKKYVGSLWMCPFQKGIFGFSIFVNNRKKVDGNTNVYNM